MENATQSNPNRATDGRPTEPTSLVSEGSGG